MLAPDTILQDRYKIIRELGSGGMGRVYEALDQRLSCIVALKETNAESDIHQRAFRHEASLLASLRHSALPNVMDYFAQKDGQYLVMEFIPGDDLAQLLKRREGPFSLEDVLTWADHLLDALDYLHRRSPPVIHRDIKPANLKVTSRGEIVLLDFGLSKGATGQMSTLHKSDGGEIGYTPAYAPLEQVVSADQNWINVLFAANAKRLEDAQRVDTDPRSDLFSLGATLYHLVTGTLAPNAPTRAVAVWSGREDPLRPANQLNPHISSTFAEGLRRAMALEMSERFHTAAEVRAALDEVSRDDAPTKERQKKKPLLPPTVLDVEPGNNRKPVNKTVSPAAIAIKYGILGKCEKQVRSVAFSPCGAFVASGSNDNAVRVWDVQTGEARVLGYCDPGESGFSYVSSVDFTSDGKSVVSGSNDKTIRLWTLQLKRMHILGPCERPVSAVSCSPDGKSIASGSSDGTIQVWNVTTGRARALGRGGGRVWAIAFASDGESIATGSADGTVRLWDAQTGEMREIDAGGGDVRSVAFSPDQQTIVLGDGDGQLRSWNIETRQTRAIGKCEGRIRSIAFAPDGTFIASGSEDKTVRVWNVQTRTMEVLGSCDDVVDSVTYSPDGKSVASGSWDNTVCLWKVAGK